MLDLSVAFKHASKVVTKNSPAILTAIGATAAVAGTYFAAKAGFQSVEVLREAEETKAGEFLGNTISDIKKNEEIESEGITFVSPESLTSQEKFEAVWKLYVPAASCIVLSVTAVIFANRINDRRAAAMATAYSIVEKSYTEHRAKTAEKLGKKKAEEVRAAVAQDRVNANPPSTVIITGSGNTRCRDEWSGRYFQSDIESIRKAVNDFNHTLINSSYLPLTELYHLIGLPSTRESDEVGWGTDQLLEVEFAGVLHPDGTPCISLDFKTLPNPRYADFH